KKSLHAIALSASGAVVASLLAGLPAASAERQPDLSKPSEPSARTAPERPALAAGLIVKYRGGASASALRAAAGSALGDDVSVRALGDRVRAYRSDPVPVAEAAEAAARVAERADVVWAAPNHVR